VTPITDQALGVIAAYINRQFAASLPLEALARPPDEGRGVMSVLLVVDRDKVSESIWVMAWTAEDDDPRLLESRRFLGEAALKVWLAGIATRYGRSNIHLNWTEALRGDARLTMVLEDVCVSSGAA
jgi:hypothetical protein